MKIKEIASDFIVEEQVNLDELKEKKKEGGPYQYFWLTKTNYPQLKAIEKIANIFNTSRKLVHFSGTKDKVGITKQLISIKGIKKENFEKNIEFLNTKVDDLEVEYVGSFQTRLNLGDNKGNKFEIVVRDLSLDECELAKVNKEIISKYGVLNYFDSQRFGYAGNSHLIGKDIIKNDLESAVYKILTSLPPQALLESVSLIDEIEQNWEKIKTQDKDFIQSLLEKMPKYMANEKKILQHLAFAKNDFPGAFRKIHKKLRTLYINAYQSYIFNSTLRYLYDKKKDLANYEHLELIHPDYDLSQKIIGPYVSSLLKEDKISLEELKLPSMPELSLNKVFRKSLIYPQQLQIKEISDDEIHDQAYKVVFSFELDAGEYATNIIKMLFKER